MISVARKLKPIKLKSITAKLSIGVCLTSLLFSQCAYAGLASDLNSYANDIGYANITGATAAMTQEGGYLSGGSGYMATKVKQMQFARVQLPNISSGCAGTDWTTGGMSFISSAKLTEFGQAIIKNAIPFSIDLALQTWAPQIASLKAKFEAIANAINNLNISSCQAAQLAVGAVAGSFMDGEGKKFLCQSYKSQGNRTSGWLAAQQGCSNQSTASKANAAAKNDKTLENLIKQDRNIVWYQFMKNNFLASNHEIAEYLMSLTGTIIYPKADGGNMQPDRRAPLITDINSSGFNELLFGSDSATKVKIYKCDTYDKEGCKNPSDQKLDIPKSDALVPKVQKILEAIGQKFINDQVLSKKELDVINAVDFPVATMIQTEIRAGFAVQYSAYADIISRIVLASYVNQLINQAQLSISRNKSATTDKDYQWILANLKSAKTLIVSQYQTRAYEALQQKQQMIMRSIEIENSVVGNLSSSTQQNYTFGGL